jgi:hypothetical protein
VPEWQWCNAGDSGWYRGEQGYLGGRFNWNVIWMLGVLLKNV